MGIARLTARCLLIEGKERPFHGSILQLGRQDIYFNMAELTEWAKLHQFSLRGGSPVTLRMNPSCPGRECIDDLTFFTRLGFDEVQSCDASGYESANYIFDMNCASPDTLAGRFDVILDGGTFEHVFNVPQAFVNVHNMLKVGGRVIHAFPVSNYVDHGFYMFSPTLFHDYYATNRYQVERCFLTGQTTDFTAECALFSYVPGSIDHLSFGGFSAKNFGKYDTFDGFFVATKKPESTAGVVPIQGRYRRVWGPDKLSANVRDQFKHLGFL